MTLGTAWPELPTEDWDATRRTLHRYCQIVGKLRMALVPFRNHWWHVTLYVDTRGLTTGPMPVGGARLLEVAFDVVDHRLVVSTSEGEQKWFTLHDGLSCANFHSQLFTALRGLEVMVEIDPAPFDLDGPPLDDDRDHDAYDADAIMRYWTILRSTSQVLARFAGGFNGKQSPVHLFWHSFDLALARFSGRPAPPRESADAVTAEAYSHEIIAFGFWPGDERVRYPAFYSYTAPAPDGLVEQPLEPAAARWLPEQASAHLPYEEVRTAADPSASLLAFLTSAYEAGARSAGWDLAAFATGRNERATR